MTARNNVLSKEFVVAAEIFHKERQKQDTNFNELVEALKPVMKKRDVAQSLDVLSDYGVVKGEYGAIKKGKAGAYLYYITSEARDTIKEIYEEYWKPNRKKYLKDN